MAVPYARSAAVERIKAKFATAELMPPTLDEHEIVLSQAVHVALNGYVDNTLPRLARPGRGAEYKSGVAFVIASEYGTGKTLALQALVLMVKQMLSPQVELYPFMPYRALYVNTECESGSEDDESSSRKEKGERWFREFVDQLGFPEGTTGNQLAVSLVDAALDKKSDNALVNTKSVITQKLNHARQTISHTLKATSQVAGHKVGEAAAAVFNLFRRGPATEEGTPGLVAASASSTLTETTTADLASLPSETLDAEETADRLFSFLSPDGSILPRVVGDRRPLLVIDNANHWSSSCDTFFLKLASEAYTRKVVVLIATTSVKAANNMCRLNGFDKITACPGTYYGEGPNAKGEFNWNGFGWTQESRLEHLRTKYGPDAGITKETYEAASQEPTIRKADKKLTSLRNNACSCSI